MMRFDSSVTKTEYDLTPTATASSTVIEASDRFSRKADRTAESLEEKEFSESIIEAKDHSMQVNFPIHIEKNEKVTIRVIRENTSTKGAFTGKKMSGISTPTSKVLNQMELELAKRNEYVEQLEEKIRTLTDIMDSNKSFEKEETTVGHNSAFKMITQVQNAALIISFVSTLIFLVFFLFDLFIPKSDAVFAFSLSLVGCLFFWLDKYHRRSLNR